MKNLNQFITEEKSDGKKYTGKFKVTEMKI
jgi:hypothetical protein